MLLGVQFQATPLHHAARFAHREVSELLLEHNAVVNARDKVRAGSACNSNPELQHPVCQAAACKCRAERVCVGCG